jgi:hypothetical protein
MATRKSSSRRAQTPSGSTRAEPRASARAAKSAARTTVSGPARADRASGDVLERKLAGAQALAAGRSRNSCDLDSASRRML